MNKRFLAIAIAAGLAVSSNVMAEGAEIYGIAHVSVNSISADSGASAIDATTVSSNNSRLGVKGSEDLGGGLKAVYKMEFGVDLADKAGDACDNYDPGCDTLVKTFANGNLTARNQYVGLSGGLRAASSRSGCQSVRQPGLPGVWIGQPDQLHSPHGPGGC